MYVYIYGVSVKKNEKQKFASYFIIMLPIKKKKKKLSYFGTKSWDFRHTHLTIAGWIIYISLDFF